MATVTMPKAGQSMEEGTILRWMKKEGDPVVRGEILLEIDTDKAAVEVESPESGILKKILCPEGTTVPVLAPIAIVAGPKDDISAEMSQAQSVPAATVDMASGPAAEPVAAGAALTETQAGRIKASPAARRTARETGVDLTAVGRGSGPEGRIISSDVLRLASLPAEAPPAAPVLSAVPAIPAGATRRPLTGMRKAIARSMLAAKQSIPHFYAKLTIDAGPLYDFYRAEKQKYPCTLNDIITLACARVIRESPAFRSRYEQEEIVEFAAASIGVAVGMDEGLVVPVLVGADSMSLMEVALESQRIIEAARQGKVTAMGQGVFTITNLGPFGVEEFTAIINPPEAAILAVGAIREDVIVRDEGMRPGRVMTMILSADHRVIDGLMAARFLKRLQEVLETPDSIATR